MDPKEKKEEEEENGRKISSGGRERRARTYYSYYSRKYIYTLQWRAEGGKRKHVWSIYGVEVDGDRGGKRKPK